MKHRCHPFQCACLQVGREFGLRSAEFRNAESERLKAESSCLRQGFGGQARLKAEGSKFSIISESAVSRQNSKQSSQQVELLWSGGRP